LPIFPFRLSPFIYDSMFCSIRFFDDEKATYGLTLVDCSIRFFPDDLTAVVLEVGAVF